MISIYDISNRKSLKKITEATASILNLYANKVNVFSLNWVQIKKIQSSFKYASSQKFSEPWNTYAPYDY